MGGFPLDAHRPPIFFFWDAHLLHFFLMGVFLWFFLTPRKSKVLVKILFSHFSIFFMGKNYFTHSTDRRGKIWLLDTFLLLLKQIPFFFKFIRPSFAHLFFFFEAPIFFKNKRWALFFGAHLSPIFFLAHLSPIPIADTGDKTILHII